MPIVSRTSACEAADAPQRVAHDVASSNAAARRRRDAAPDSRRTRRRRGKTAPCVPATQQSARRLPRRRSLALTVVMRTRARSCGSGPKQKTTRPPARPTACPLAKRSVKSRSTSAPTRSAGSASRLRAVSLFVKRLEQLSSPRRSTAGCAGSSHRASAGGASRRARRRRSRRPPRRRRRSRVGCASDLALVSPTLSTSNARVSSHGFAMISDPALYRRRDSVLLWALALSLLVHLLGFLLFGAIRGHLPSWLHRQNKPEQIVMLSSSTTIEHRAVPQRPQPMRRGSHSAAATRPVAPRPQVRPRVAAAPPALRELTQPAPSATPMPQPHRSAAPVAQSFAQRLAREEAAFSREVAQLRRQNNPLSVATIPPRPASAYRRVYMNVSGVKFTQGGEHRGHRYDRARLGRRRTALPLREL